MQGRASHLRRRLNLMRALAPLEQSGACGVEAPAGDGRIAASAGSPGVSTHSIARLTPGLETGALPVPAGWQAVSSPANWRPGKSPGRPFSAVRPHEVKDEGHFGG